MNDAFDQKLRAPEYCRGFPTVSLSVAIPRGPRQVKAGITLSYEGQYPIEFKSQVVWPKGESFESAVREGILDALLKNGTPTIGGRFSLTTVELDQIHSSPHAFRLVAFEATVTLLRLLQRDSQSTKGEELRPSP